MRLSSRGRGLFICVEIDPDRVAAMGVCKRLMARGLLGKKTHQTTVRLTPPLAIDRDSLHRAADQLQKVLEEMDASRKAS